jgi:uncharacterized protein YbjT (DUF2867 family)
LQESKGRIAWLAGATGLVGGFVLKRLIDSGRYATLVVLTRRTVHAEDPKIDQRIVNFDQLAAMDLPAADEVFCALGTTIKKAGSQEAFRHVELDFPLALAKKALARNAKQFLLVSSVGANAKSTNFYLRTKGELEDAVSALPFKAVNIFRPSMLVGPREERRPAERAGIVFMKLVSPMLRKTCPSSKYRYCCFFWMSACTLAYPVGIPKRAESTDADEYFVICVVDSISTAKFWFAAAPA